MVTTKNLNFFIAMLRAPSMCGHKGTKIFLKTFSLLPIAVYLASFAFLRWAWCVNTVRSFGSKGHQQKNDKKDREQY